MLENFCTLVHGVKAQGPVVRHGLGVYLLGSNRCVQVQPVASIPRKASPESHRVIVSLHQNTGQRQKPNKSAMVATKRSQCSHVIQQKWGSRKPHFAYRLCVAFERTFHQAHRAAPRPTDERERVFQPPGDPGTFLRLRHTFLEGLLIYTPSGRREALQPDDSTPLPSTTCEQNPFVRKIGEGKCGSFWNIKIIVIEHRMRRRVCWSSKDINPACVYHHLKKVYFERTEKFNNIQRNMCDQGDRYNLTEKRTYLFIILRC